MLAQLRQVPFDAGSVGGMAVGLDFYGLPIAHGDVEEDDLGERVGFELLDARGYVGIGLQLPAGHLGQLHVDVALGKAFVAEAVELVGGLAIGGRADSEVRRDVLRGSAAEDVDSLVVHDSSEPHLAGDVKRNQRSSSNFPSSRTASGL